VAQAPQSFRGVQIAPKVNISLTTYAGNSIQVPKDVECVVS